MAPFFISMFYLDNFWYWLTFALYILLFGLVITIFGFTSRIEKFENPVNRMFIRIVAIIIGVGLVIFFAFVFSSSFLDIPPFLDKNYEVIIGRPDLISSINSRSVFQTIEINNISLKSVYIIPESNLLTEYKAYYLPHSKYVIKLIEIN